MTLGPGERNPRQPLVSVVVPAWNSEGTLAETLESVAAQTYRHLEVVIVEDGSSDGTAAVAARFCEMEPRARLVRQENRGLPGARNRGIAESAGEWIAPVDADDIWHPTKIEKQVRAALDAQQPVGFVYCWYRFIDERGFVIGSGPRWTVNGPAFRQLSYDHFLRGGSGLLLSRQAASAFGFYDETLRQGCEDVWLQLQMARFHPVAAVPEYLFGYRVRAGSMTSDFGQMMRSWFAVYDRVRSDGAPISAQVAGWVESRWCFEAAQGAAVAGDYRGTAGYLLKALWLDPVMTGLKLLYRTVRLGVRLVRGRRARGPQRHFYETDTTSDMRSDPDELRWLSGFPKRLDARRMARLNAQEALEARADQAMARAATVTG